MPMRFEFCGNRVDRVTGGDAVEVDLDRGVLAQLIAIDAQVLVTDSLPHLGQRLGSWGLFPHEPAGRIPRD